MSAIVSPRPMCVVCVSMTSGRPPSSAMPTVNETRVRSDGLSNRTATARGPSSGRRPNRSCLHRRGEREDLGLLGRGQVVVAQEVPDGHGAYLSPWARVKMAGRAAVNSSASVWVRIERRGEPHRVRLDGVDQEARLPGGGGDVGRPVLGEDGGEPEAAAADAVEQRVVDRLDAVGQRLADQLDVIEQVGGLDRVEHREGGGAGDRVAAEGRAMVARLQRGGAVAEADAGADRQAAAEALGQGEDVGGDPFGLVREPRAGPADAGLDLVEHQQRAGPVAGRAGGGEVAGRGGDDAALALGRLEDDRRGLLVDRLAEGVGVAVVDPADVEAERGERRADRLLAGDRERAHRAAVEAVVGGDDHRAVLALLAADQLERGLVGLGAGVAEEDPRAAVRVGLQQDQQLLRQLDARLVHEQVAGVREPADLGRSPR